MQRVKHDVKQWLKKSPSPIAKACMSAINAIRFFQVPSISLIHKPLYWLHLQVKNSWENLIRILYWTPLFKTRLQRYGQRFYLYSGMPLVMGNLTITLGDNVRMSGISTLCGRSCAAETPELIIGNNVDVGWQNTLAVGRKIVLGNNVRLAGKVFLAGFPGHPLDPAARAQGLPETDEQVGDIILKEDVWLATGVTVMAGVTIGKGTVVAAGSVVTQDLPAGVVAGGVPARVLKHINGKAKQEMAA